MHNASAVAHSVNPAPAVHTDTTHNVNGNVNAAVLEIASDDKKSTTPDATDSKRGNMRGNNSTSSPFFSQLIMRNRREEESFRGDAKTPPTPNTPHEMKDEAKGDTNAKNGSTQNPNHSTQQTDSQKPSVHTLHGSAQNPSHGSAQVPSVPSLHRSSWGSAQKPFHRSSLARSQRCTLIGSLIAFAEAELGEPVDFGVDLNDKVDDALLQQVDDALLEQVESQVHQAAAAAARSSRTSDVAQANPALCTSLCSSLRRMSRRREQQSAVLGEGNDNPLADLSAEERQRIIDEFVQASGLAGASLAGAALPSSATATSSSSAPPASPGLSLANPARQDLIGAQPLITPGSCHSAQPLEKSPAEAQKGSSPAQKGTIWAGKQEDSRNKPDPNASDSLSDCSPVTGGKTAGTPNAKTIAASERKPHTEASVNVASANGSNGSVKRSSTESVRGSPVVGAVQHLIDDLDKLEEEDANGQLPDRVPDQDPNRDLHPDRSTKDSGLRKSAAESAQESPTNSSQEPDGIKGGVAGRLKCNLMLRMTQSRYVAISMHCYLDFISNS
jgi:hypothetical protein